jgi:hypothetical protein
MESHYLTSFAAGVTVDSRESFKKFLKDFPCLKRDIKAKNQPCMYSTAQQEDFQQFQIFRIQITPEKLDEIQNHYVEGDRSLKEAVEITELDTQRLKGILTRDCNEL